MATEDVVLFGKAALRIGELAETTVAQVYPHTWLDSGGGNDDHFLTLGAYEEDGFELTGVDGETIQCAVAHLSDPMDEYIASRFIDYTIKYKELHDLLEAMSYDVPLEDAMEWDDTNHQYFVDWDAFTRKKMDISFQGALIGGTNYYGFTINFPNLKVKDPEALVSGAGKIPATVTFLCLGTDAAPTGMTGITKPFQFDIMNTRSTDPLA